MLAAAAAVVLISVLLGLLKLIQCTQGVCALEKALD